MQHYVGPFCIIEKVSCLALKLNVPPDWRIHLVFFVAQLKLALPPGKDSFARPFPSNPPLVFVESDTNRLKSFEIEKPLNKRKAKKGKSQTVEYLVC